MNDIGKEGREAHPLSKSWFDRQPQRAVEAPGRPPSNFFRRVAKHASSQRLDDMEGSQDGLKGEGYSRNSSTPDKAPSASFRERQGDQRLPPSCCGRLPLQPLLSPGHQGYFEGMGSPSTRTFYALCQPWSSGYGGPRSQRRDGQRLHPESERMRTICSSDGSASGSTPELVREIAAGRRITLPSH